MSVKLKEKRVKQSEQCWRHQEAGNLWKMNVNKKKSVYLTTDYDAEMDNKFWLKSVYAHTHRLHHARVLYWLMNESRVVFW